MLLLYVNFKGMEDTIEPAIQERLRSKKLSARNPLITRNQDDQKYKEM